MLSSLRIREQAAQAIDSTVIRQTFGVKPREKGYKTATSEPTSNRAPKAQLQPARDHDSDNDNDGDNNNTNNSNKSNNNKSSNRSHETPTVPFVQRPSSPRSLRQAQLPQLPVRVLKRAKPTMADLRLDECGDLP